MLILENLNSENKNKEWYIDIINQLDKRTSASESFAYDSNHHKARKKNYDLFNGILDPSIYGKVLGSHTFQGENNEDIVAELPANLMNHDIVSGKIKSLIGMELQRPFNHRLIAVNREATTRKEQHKFGQVKDFVQSFIMKPIYEEIEIKYQEQTKGKQLTQEEKETISKQIDEELKSATPDEVEKYMLRKHQDPAEIQGNQILNDLIKRLRIKHQFGKAWKHGLLTADIVYYCGIIGGKLKFKAVNSLNFDYARSKDIEFIEDSDWCWHEFNMSPVDVVSIWDKELTDVQKQEIFTYVTQSDRISFDENSEEEYGVRIVHCQWKAPTKMKFLKYYDENGEVQQMRIDNKYKFEPEKGDIEIETKILPEIFEGYKIGDDIYVSLNPTKGQVLDSANLRDSKLDYFGITLDNDNSKPTSPMDRVAPYQYLHNIIMYRIELLMGSDKGKKLLMNIKTIPKTSGINLEKWLYYADMLNIYFYNPDEEGQNPNMSASSVGSTIDQSLISDITKYMNIAEAIKIRCGEALGMPKEVEGQISQRDAVTNVQQTIVQSNYILEPYFSLHNAVKQNALESLINKANLLYSINPPEYLPYILDDLSIEMIKLNQEYLDTSAYGLYMEDSSNAHRIKQNLEQLTHAALQNQRITMSDVAKILKSDDITEIEEMLQISELNGIEREQRHKMAEIEAQSKENENIRNHQRELWNHEKEMIILKEEERRKTEIQKQAILSIGFNEDKDVDNDGELDVLEVAKHNVNVELKTKELTLEERKFEHQKKIDEEKLKIEKNKPKPKNNK